MRILNDQQFNTPFLGTMDQDQDSRQETIQGLKEQIENEINTISGLKDKIEKLKTYETPKNPFKLTRIDFSTDFSINLSLEMTVDYPTSIVAYRFIPSSNKIAFGTEDSITIFSIPLITTPNKITFMSPQEKLVDFAIAAQNFAIIAQFSTGDVRPLILREGIWGQPLLNSTKKVIIKTSSCAVMIQYPPNNVYLANQQLEQRFNNSVGDCQIVAAELSPNGPYAIFLTERNEVYLFTYNSFTIEKKLDVSFTAAAFSINATSLALLNSSNLYSFSLPDLRCKGMIKTTSKAIGIDQVFIISVEPLPGSNDVYGAVIYDSNTLKIVATLEIEDDQIDTLETSSKYDHIQIAFKLKSGKIAIFQFRSSLM